MQRLKNIIVIFLLSFISILLLKTNVYAESLDFSIDDDAGLYSDEEEQELTDTFKDIGRDIGNIYIKTTNETSGNTPADAHSYYASKYGYAEGTIFLIDMGNRQVYIYSTEKVHNTYMTTRKANAITDNVYRYLKAGNYYEGTYKALEQMGRAYNGESIESPMQKIMSILMGILLGFILTFYVAILTSMQKKKDSYDDRNSLIQNDLNCVGVNKIFVRTYKVESSSSSGGCSSGDGGSSGGGGGGGGHSF